MRRPPAEPATTRSVAFVGADRAAERRGRGVGLRLTMVNATQTVLPTVFGSAGSVLALFMSGALTFAPLFWGVALMVGSGGVALLRRPPRRESAVSD